MQPPAVFGLLAVLALAACGAHCLRPLIRAPRSVKTTGRYIAVLKESTSRERLVEIVEHLRDATGGCKVDGYMEAMKAITLQLSDGALQKVCHIPYLPYIIENNCYFYTKFSSQSTLRAVVLACVTTCPARFF